MSDEAKWYVVHTYSGYENKVASNLEKTVENHSLQNLIFEIRVPTEGHRSCRKRQDQGSGTQDFSGLRHCKDDSHG